MSSTTQHPSTDRRRGRSFLDSLLAELNRRRVFQVATAYAVVAFILLQVAEITFEPLALPAWALTALILAVVLAFPVVMALAWVFDLTPDGIRRTQANEDTSRRGSLAMLLAVLALDAGAAWFLYDLYAPVQGNGDVAAAPGAAPVMSALEAPAGPPPGSVAVLPFEDLSEGGATGYFAQGFSVDIHSLLNRAEALRVPGRSSSFAFAGQRATLDEIGRTLNVGAVLEGTLRRAREGDDRAERVHVTAELVDTASGFILWSGTWDRPVDEVLTVQDEIVSGVVALLTDSDDFELAPSVESRAPASFEAFDRYLEGRDHWRQRTPESLALAIVAFEEVMALDPAYAPAYAGLADAYLLLAAYGNLGIGEAVRQAEPLIHTALKLDGELSEAFASLGLLYWNLGRYGPAENHLRRALFLDPENVVAYVWLSGLIASQGRLGEQEVILRQGLERDPLNLLLNINLASNELERGRLEDGFQRLEDTREIFPTRTLVLRTLADWHARTGAPARALALLDQTLALAPREPPNHVLLADILMSLGALEPARRALDEAQAVGPDNASVTMTRATFLWRSGRLEELEQLVEGLLENTGENVIAGKEALMPHYWLGRIRLRLDEPDAAAESFAYLLEDSDRLPPSFVVDILTWNAIALDASGNESAASEARARAAEQLLGLHLEGISVAYIAYLDAVLAALDGDADGALTHLAEAVRRGWRDAWEAEQDRRLAAIRSRPAFDALLAQVRAENEAALAGAPERLLAGSRRGVGSLAAQSR